MVFFLSALETSYHFFLAPLFLMQNHGFKLVFPTVKGFPGDASGKELVC